MSQLTGAEFQSFILHPNPFAAATCIGGVVTFAILFASV